MSTLKRPLSDLQNSQTPTRYAPSTPHAIRALQQRSGAAKTRSVRRRNRIFNDGSGNNDSVRPDSARGILRRLAKLTAPTTKRSIPTPSASVRGKENVRPGGEGDGKEWGGFKRPRLTLDIEDSLEEEVEPPEVADEDEDSELPIAPTPSFLPDDDNNPTSDNLANGDPTITFRSIDFARQSRQSGGVDVRRASRLLFPASEPAAGDDDAEEDPTILSEMGRRAISEEPTGRLSRYSFGSIRMGDFGSELEIRRESDQERNKLKVTNVLDDYIGIGLEDDDQDLPLEYGEETEHLRNLPRSPTLPPPQDESTMFIPALDESFQLEFQDQEAVAHHAKSDALLPVTVNDHTTELESHADVESTPNSSGRNLDEEIEEPAAEVTAKQIPPRRRKKLKMTRHGTMVPSLPSSLIKRVAIEAQARLGNRKPKLGRDHMKALEQATEWFFEQVGEDLEAYSNHARRKKRVDASDVLMLMRRQRVLKDKGELAKAAREILPREALAELDIPDEL